MRYPDDLDQNLVVVPKMIFGLRISIISVCFRECASR
jgi:hypothetical protein